MADIASNILLSIKSDTKQARSELKKLSKAEQQAAKEFIEGQERRNEKIDKQIALLGKVAVGVGAVVGAYKLLSDSADFYAKRQQLVAASAGADIAGIEQAAQGLLTTTEALTFAAAAQNTAFNISQKEMEVAARAMISLRNQGNELADVQRDVTQALVEGSGEPLKKYGLGIKGAAGEVETFKNLMAGLRVEADKTAKGTKIAGDEALAAGIQFKNATDKLRLELGKVAVALTPVVEALAFVADKIAELANFFGGSDDTVEAIARLQKELINLEKERLRIQKEIAEEGTFSFGKNARRADLATVEAQIRARQQELAREQSVIAQRESLKQAAQLQAQQAIAEKKIVVQLAEEMNDAAMLFRDASIKYNDGVKEDKKHRGKAASFVADKAILGSKELTLGSQSFFDFGLLNPGGFEARRRQRGTDPEYGQIGYVPGQYPFRPQSAGQRFALNRGLETDVGVFSQLLLAESRLPDIKTDTAVANILERDFGGDLEGQIEKLGSLRKEWERLQAVAVKAFGPPEDPRLTQTFDAMAEGFDGVSEAISGATFAMSTFQTIGQQAFSAWIDGSKSFGQAMEDAGKRAVAAIAQEMFARALYHGAYAVGAGAIGLGMLAFGDGRGAAMLKSAGEHAAAAGAFAAGAIALGSIAKTFSVNQASGSGLPDGARGLDATGQGGSSSQTFIVVQDQFDDDPRAARRRLKRAFDRAQGEYSGNPAVIRA